MEYTIKMTDVIAKIFTHCGYSVKYGVFLDGDNPQNKEYIPDYIIQKGDRSYIVELKAPRSMTIAQPTSLVRKFLKCTESEYMDYGRMMVLVCDIPKKELERLRGLSNEATLGYRAFEILGLNELLDMASDDLELCNEFASLLSKTIKLPKTNIKKAKTDNIEELIREVENWHVCDDDGNNRHIAYEKLCVRVLKALFSNELELWKEQTTTLDDLHRFDILCKIKAKGNDFWDLLEQHFHSKYIIFECKNYRDKITQREIFTTEKYLYSTALRKVAFIISVKGTGENADKAIRGVLRENGKLIISVTNEDLVSMLKCKRDGLNPANDVLSVLLDELLITLEK